MNVRYKTSQTKVFKLVSKGAVLVDTRNPVAYRDGSIPGAVSVPLRQVSTLFKHPKNTTFIFFGEEVDVKSEIRYMNDFGFSNAFDAGEYEDLTKPPQTKK